MLDNCSTHKKVPPENSNSNPVKKRVPCSFWPIPPSKMLTSAQVNNAPIGAAKLNTIRWLRALLLESPCLSNAEVRPNAAGALCIIKATNTMNPNLRDEAVEEAPSAIPSAAAWITNPTVVEEGRDCCIGPGGGPSKSSDSEDWFVDLWRLKRSSAIWNLCGWEEAAAWRGS